MKHQSPFRLLATLVLAAAPSLLAGAIAYSQNPDPFSIAYITSISYFNLIPTGGEADDQATNVALVAPNPTIQNPLKIASGGTANIKLSWDAIDSIKDNDIDFGDWTAFFDVVFHLPARKSGFAAGRA